MPHSSSANKWEINMPGVAQLANCWAGIPWLTAGIHQCSHSSLPCILCLPTPSLHLWCLVQLWAVEGKERHRSWTSANICCALIFYAQTLFLSRLFLKEIQKGWYHVLNLHIRKLRQKEVWVLTLRKSTLSSKDPALSIMWVQFHKIKEQHMTKGR